MNPAGQSVSEAQVSIEVCKTHDDIRRCVELQRAIWGDPDEDLTPSIILIVANKIGGHVLLARDGAKPVGFALAFPAFRGEQRYLHSHIVGVLPEYQGQGVGLRLKLKQRDLAIAMRIPWMEWTFDPLALRNAQFNVVRLGAVIRRFHSNLYGVTASPLHGGLPTDRLVAEWRLSSARVESALGGGVVGGGALGGSAPAAAQNAVRIVVPAEMEEWKRSGSPRAAEVQAALKAEFQQRFADGFAVTGFRIEDRNGIYLLERREI